MILYSVKRELKIEKNEGLEKNMSIENSAINAREENIKENKAVKKVLNDKFNTIIKDIITINKERTLDGEAKDIFSKIFSWIFRGCKKGEYERRI